MYAYEQFKKTFNTAPLSSGSKWLGQMVAHPLPKNINIDTKIILLNKYKIEVPIFKWNNQSFIRTSIQIYNDKNDIDYLMSVLRTIN